MRFDEGRDRGGVVEGGEGDDTVQFLDGAATIYGNGGDDDLRANVTADDYSGSLFFGGLGDDSIGVHGNGDSTVHGNLGDDVITQAGGEILVYGNQGDDVILQSQTTGVVYGGQGNDLIVDADVLGSLTMVGGGGNDTFGIRVWVSQNGGDASDIVITDFGAGDALLFDSDWDGVTMDFAMANDMVLGVRDETAGGDVLISFRTTGGNTNTITLEGVGTGAIDDFTDLVEVFNVIYS